MKLNDDEKKEIIQAIESGRPLPDKYHDLLFDDKPEIELVWNGKTREVCNIVLPFQVIEQVDEPRTEEKYPADQYHANPADQYGFYDTQGRQIADWRNKLIWGDNKLVLSSLRIGPMRDDIEKAGGLKLIYIDPPFAVGDDFSMKIEVSNTENDTQEVQTKKPSVLEEIAYRDTWGSGADSFIAMLYERLCLMRDLLAEDGCIYVHCDWRMNSYIRLAMDEIFGRENFRNEIVVSRIKKNVHEHENARTLNADYDNILLFSKSKKIILVPPKIKTNKGERWHSFYAPGYSANLDYELFGHRPGAGRHWRWAKERAEQAIRDKILRANPNTGRPEYLVTKDYEVIGTNWTDITAYTFKYNYPTEKSEALLTRILLASSNPGDLVADFFCGSGTTLAVAEKLGRKWIGCDLGKFAIHTTRKRMITVQRELKAKGQDFRGFEILHLGKYERAYYIGKNCQ